MNKTKLKITAGLLVVFLLGAFSGALGTGIYIRHRIQRFTHKTPREHKDSFVERLSKSLELTDAQKQQMERIFSDTDNEIQTMMENSQKQFDALMDQRRAQVQKILSPDQQKKLDAFFERLEKRRPDFGFPPPPPDRGDSSRPPDDRPPPNDGE